MPRGKFVPKETRLNVAPKIEVEEKPKPSQIKLIKSQSILTESVLETSEEFKKEATAPHIKLVEHSEKHSLSFLFTFLLIALFVLVNIGLAVLMKDDANKATETPVIAKTQTPKLAPAPPTQSKATTENISATVQTKTPLSVTPPVIAPSPRPVGQTAPSQAPSSQAPSSQAPSIQDLLSIISKE